MAVELVDRIYAILVAVCRFLGVGAIADSRSLRFESYARMQHFVRRTTSILVRRFWGMWGENSCSVFLLLFMVLWVPVSTTLCTRALLMLWHAFLFLGLRFFPLFFILLGGLRCFFL
jgi:hypothetical protein